MSDESTGMRSSHTSSSQAIDTMSDDGFRTFLEELVRNNTTMLTHKPYKYYARLKYLHCDGGMAVKINWYAQDKFGCFVDGIYGCSPEFIRNPSKRLSANVLHMLYEHQATAYVIEQMEPSDQTEKLKSAYLAIRRAMEYIYGKYFPGTWEDVFGMQPNCVEFPHEEMSKSTLRSSVAHGVMMNHIAMIMHFWGTMYNAYVTPFARMMSIDFGYIIAYMFGDDISTHPDIYAGSLLPREYYPGCCPDKWCINKGLDVNTQMCIKQDRDPSIYTNWDKLCNACVMWRAPGESFITTEAVKIDGDTFLMEALDKLLCVPHELSDGIFPPPGTTTGAFTPLRSTVWPNASPGFRYKLKLLNSVMNMSGRIPSCDDSDENRQESEEVDVLIKHLKIALRLVPMCKSDLKHRNDNGRIHALTHIRYYMKHIKLVIDIVVIIANLYWRYLGYPDDSCEKRFSDYCGEVLTVLYDIRVGTHVPSVASMDPQLLTAEDSTEFVRLRDVVDAMRQIVAINARCNRPISTLLGRILLWRRAFDTSNKEPMCGLFYVLYIDECTVDEHYHYIMLGLGRSLSDEYTAVRTYYASRKNRVSYQIDRAVTYLQMYIEGGRRTLSSNFQPDIIMKYCFSLVVFIVGAYLITHNIIQSGECIDKRVEGYTSFKTRLHTIITSLFGEGMIDE
jgi:hypothetical protein